MIKDFIFKFRCWLIRLVVGDYAVLINCSICDGTVVLSGDRQSLMSNVLIQKQHLPRVSRRCSILGRCVRSRRELRCDNGRRPARMHRVRVAHRSRSSSRHAAVTQRPGER